MSTATETNAKTHLLHINGRCALCGKPASGQKHIMVKGLFRWVSLTTRVCPDCYVKTATAWAAEELEKGPESGAKHDKP